MTPRSLRRFTVVVLSASAGGLLASCSGAYGVALPGAGGIELTEEERLFGPGVEAARGDGDLVTLSPEALRAPPQSTMTQGEALGASGSLDVGTRAAGAPLFEASGAPEAPGAPMAVDALIGDVNGRPIFASEFFQESEARIVAELTRRNEEDWKNWLRAQVNKDLFDLVRDELILADFTTSLDPETRQGLLAFVDRIRDGLISLQGGGSAEVAERELLESEGKTLDEMAMYQRDDTLIRMQLEKEVWSKVEVSWRDVEIEYERRFQEFNPPPSAHLRLIIVQPKGGEDEAARVARVEEIKGALEGGTPFEEVALDYSQYKPEAGGLFFGEEGHRLDAGGYARTEFFSLPELNDAAIELKPGETSPPIAVGEAVYWVHLDRVDEIKRSLYDVQDELMADIRARRLNEQSKVYLEKLLGEYVVTDLKEMEERLYQFALSKHLRQTAK